MVLRLRLELSGLGLGLGWLVKMVRVEGGSGLYVMSMKFPAKTAKQGRVSVCV